MIVITIENYSREFESKFQLACGLAQQFNHEVILLPKRIINDYQKYLQKITIIHQSYAKSMNTIFSDKLENDIRLYILEEEILHRTISLDDQRAIAPNIVDGFFATTQEDYDDLTSRYKSKVTFTGHPRFNTYFQKFEIPKEISDIGNFSLFSSNFSMLAPISNNLLDKVIKDNNFEDDKEFKLREYIDAHLVRAERVLNYLKEKSSTETIVYRPHPLEDIQYAKDFFEGSSVIVNKDFSIYPWLRATQQLLHSNCTSAIEASMMDVSVNFIEPLECEHEDQPFYHSDYYTRLLDYDHPLVTQNSKQSILWQNFWPAGVPEAIQKITHVVDPVSAGFCRRLLNTLFILYGLFFFHYRKLKTPKEHSRYNQSEVFRVLTGAENLDNIKTFNLFEAVLVRKR